MRCRLDSGFRRSCLVTRSAARGGRRNGALLASDDIPFEAKRSFWVRNVAADRMQCGSLRVDEHELEWLRGINIVGQELLRLLFTPGEELAPGNPISF